MKVFLSFVMSVILVSPFVFAHENLEGIWEFQKYVCGPNVQHPDMDFYDPDPHPSSLMEYQEYSTLTYTADGKVVWVTDAPRVRGLCNVKYEGSSYTIIEGSGTAKPLELPMVEYEVEAYELDVLCMESKQKYSPKAIDIVQKVISKKIDDGVMVHHRFLLDNDSLYVFFGRNHYSPFSCMKGGSLYYLHKKQ